MYDTPILWIARHKFMNTWIITESEPSSAPINIITQCQCPGGINNCALTACEFYWGEIVSIPNLLPDVTISDRKCETCLTNDDCNVFRAEICCDGIIQCPGIPPNKCVHVGWVQLLDDKIYVLENTGSVAIPVRRDGFPQHINLTVMYLTYV